MSPLRRNRFHTVCKNSATVRGLAEWGWPHNHAKGESYAGRFGIARSSSRIWFTMASNVGGLARASLICLAQSLRVSVAYHFSNVVASILLLCKK